MLTGPVDVTEEAASSSSGMTIADIDLFELNEAFASVVLRYMQAFDLDPDKVNVNGGAIAIGHPLGATGAMILGTVLDELERTRQVHRAGHAVHRRRHGHRDHHRAGLRVGSSDMADKNFKVETDADGIALVTWDMPGRSMNVLDETSTRSSTRSSRTQRPTPRSRASSSPRERRAFCAGADLSMLRG